MTVMTGAAEDRAPRRNLGAIDEDHLFATGLVTSAPHPRTRWERIGGQLSLVGHVVVILLVIFLPIFWPEEMPEQGDRRVIPRIMTATTAGMVAVTVALTLFAGPLYALCANIGDALLTPVTLVQLEQEVSR